MHAKQKKDRDQFFDKLGNEVVTKEFSGWIDPAQRKVGNEPAMPKAVRAALLETMDRDFDSITFKVMKSNGEKPEWYTQDEVRKMFSPADLKAMMRADIERLEKSDQLTTGNLFQALDAKPNKDQPLEVKEVQKPVTKVVVQQIPQQPLVMPSDLTAVPRLA